VIAALKSRYQRATDILLVQDKQKLYRAPLAVN